MEVAALAAERSPDGGRIDVVSTLIAVLALLVAVYGAVLSTRNLNWQRRRDEERRRSDIDIGLHSTLRLPNEAARA